MTENLYVTSTEMLNDYGTEINTNLYKWADNFLRKETKKGNTKFTRGVLINEALAWYYTKRGELDSTRARLVYSAEKKLGENISDAVKKTKDETNPARNLYCEYNGPRTDRTKNQRQVNVMSFVDDCLPGYGDYEVIGDSLIELYESPWSGVYEYAETIMDIYDYVENDQRPEDPVAKAIILQTEMYSSLCVDDEDTTIKQLNDMIVDDDYEWYQDPDLTIDELQTFQNNDGTQLKSNEKDKKLGSLANALNDQQSITEDQLRQHLIDIFGVSSYPTVRDYRNHLENNGIDVVQESSQEEEDTAGEYDPLELVLDIEFAVEDDEIESTEQDNTNRIETTLSEITRYLYDKGVIDERRKKLGKEVVCDLEDKSPFIYNTPNRYTGDRYVVLDPDY